MSKYIKYLTGIYILLTLLILVPRIHGNDGIGYFVYLRSMVMDGDWDFSNEYAHFGEGYKIVGYSPVTGRPVNGVPMGSAILWFPFYLLSHLLVLLMNQFHISWVADGYSFPYVMAISLASSFYGFLGLYLLYRMAVRFYPERIVFISILIFWLSSPLVFYMFLHPSMAHANSVFTVSLFFYLWLRIYLDKCQRVYDWIFLGVSAGLLTIVRLQDSLFLLLLLFLYKPDKGLNWKYILNFVYCFIAFLIVLSPQLIAWNAIFGSYFSGPESHTIGNNLNLLNPKIFFVLFSGRHGLITWNPVILLGLLGIPILYRKNKSICIGLIIIFLLQLWVISSWREWWGAHSFGHRMFLTSSPLFIFGLCGLFEWANRRMIESEKSSIQRPFTLSPIHRFILLGIFLILWNFGLIFQYTTGMIDRDGTTPFGKVIQNQFTKVPQTLFSEILNSYTIRFKP